jgi:hypothetical protein
LYACLKKVESELAGGQLKSTQSWTAGDQAGQLSVIQTDFIWTDQAYLKGPFHEKEIDMVKWSGRLGLN